VVFTYYLTSQSLVQLDDRFCRGSSALYAAYLRAGINVLATPFASNSAPGPSGCSARRRTRGVEAVCSATPRAGIQTRLRPLVRLSDGTLVQVGKSTEGPGACWQDSVPLWDW